MKTRNSTSFKLYEQNLKKDIPNRNPFRSLDISVMYIPCILNLQTLQTLRFLSPSNAILTQKTETSSKKYLHAYRSHLSQRKVLEYHHVSPIGAASISSQVREIHRLLVPYQAPLGSSPAISYRWPFSYSSRMFDDARASCFLLACHRENPRWQRNPCSPSLSMNTW